jgi:hypothetical protein
VGERHATKGKPTMSADTVGQPETRQSMEGKLMPNSVVGKILALFLVLEFLATACALSTEEIITGTVNQDDSGQIVIEVDNGKGYLVKGMDLATSIGRTVKVTGTLAEEGDHKSITVMTVEEIEQVEGLAGDDDLEDVDK